MKRGLQSEKAQEELLEIAHRRGHVQHYVHRTGNLCEFTIMCPGLVCFVTAVRLLKLSSTPEDILHEYAAVIGQLRFIASSPAVSRELWLRTPRGAWRFFRISDDGILEIDRHGMPLANGTGPVMNAESAAAEGKRMVPDPAFPGRRTSADDRQLPAVRGPVPEKDPAPGTEHPVHAAEKAGGPWSAPVAIISPVNNPGSPGEPDLSEFPKVNLELFRVFMRQRERQKKSQCPAE